MGTPSSELQRFLAKRRAAAEEVFESSVTPATAERQEHAADASPPWLAAAAAMGVEFSNPSCSGSQGSLKPSAPGPPWLAAATEAGVVFYDPEGREIEVPVSKVRAFNEALDKVRDFERTFETDDVVAAPEAAPACSQPEVAHGYVQAAPLKSHSSAGPKQPDGAQPSDSEADAVQRQDLKDFVQKLYFALLRDGLEPNEAAAQAILQARSLKAQQAEGAAPSSRSSPRSCSSSAQEDEHRSKCLPAEEVTVSA
eukprot:TRINITY_DN109905_c0_g1_i1.p1 TRINITY_DN109905_c0_g1~~TRINITY_DN109905_c0_g1_i1.p1  ORF type:complete len:277 (-),score=64.20 TRINITY_DN109905_c0_g1_i1:79-840(-)